MTIYAVIKPLNPTSGLRETVRLSSGASRGKSVFAGNKYWPAINKLPQIGLNVFDGDFSTAIKPGSCSLDISLVSMADEYPNASDYRWPGSDISLTYVDDKGNTQEIFVGKVSRFGEKSGILGLSAEVDVEPFKADVLSYDYAGTTGIEGGSDIKGKPKPLVIGRALNVSPVQIDTVDNVFQVSSYGPVQAIQAIYERGASFGASIGNYADYAALIAADIPEGRWGTCHANGLFRLGAPPYGVITADVDGLVHGGTWIRKTGQIIKALVAMAGISSSLVDTNSFNDLDIAVPFNINVVISGQIDVLSIAQRLAIACNAQAGINLLGQLFVTRLNTDSPAIILNSEGKNLPAVMDIAELSTRPPYKRIIMGANRSWRVHSFDEIAFQAQLIECGLFDIFTVYREGNIVELSNGSRWVFVGTEPEAGVTPGDTEPKWQMLVDGTIVDYENVTGTEELEQSIDAATLTIIPDKTGFTFVNGTLSPASQTITLAAQVKGVNTKVAWATIPNIKSASDTATFAISNADMDGNNSVVVIATLTGNVKAAHTISTIADGSATIGAPAGTNVGARSVEEVNSDLDDAKQGVEDLVITYGSTTSAAASAAAAATSEAAALASENAAQSSAGAAFISQQNADTSADEASTSESNAAASATASGASATAANASNTSAGAHAAAASTSANLSASFATRAGSYAETTGLAPNSRFTQGKDSWYNGIVPAALPETNHDYETNYQGAAHVLVNSSGARRNLAGRTFPIDPSRKYRAVARIWSNGQGGTNYFGFQAMGPDGEPIGYNNGLSYAIASNTAYAAGWHDLQSDIITGEHTTSSVMFRTGATGARMIAFTNYSGASTASQIIAIAYLDFIDVTEVEAAGEQAGIATSEASAAAASATSANTDAATATSQAGLAATYRSDALSYRNTASTHAGTATSQAAIATAEAAAAEASASLSASLATGHINPNSGFSDWADGQSYPTGWGNWSGSSLTRVAGVGASKWQAQNESTAGANSGFISNGEQKTLQGSGWYVLEAEVELVSGTFQGAGVHFAMDNSAGSAVGYARLSFTGNDAAGNSVGNGVVGLKYRFAEVFQVHANTRSYKLYCMNHYTGFTSSILNGTGTGAATISVANTIRWKLNGIREANPAEIASQTVLPPLQASVTVNQAAIASIEGSAAYFEQVVAAGGSTPAIFKMLAGKNGSGIALGGDAIYITNEIDSQVVEVASFQGGIARMNAALIRDLRVPPTTTSDIFHPVMLKPLVFYAEHNEVLQYQGGASYGQAPDSIDVDIAGASLPALAAGEAYDIRAIDITATSFKLRAIKTTAAESVTRTSAAGTNVGGTPAWQTNKPTAENAKDGVYNFFFTVTLTKVGSTQVDIVNENLPSTWKYTSTYSGTISLYGKVGSSWTVLWTGTVSSTFKTTGTQTGHNATRSFTLSKSVNSSANFGSGAARFGIHQGAGATITAFPSVKYSTQTLGSETAVGGLFKVSVNPPIE